MGAGPWKKRGWEVGKEGVESGILKVAESGRNGKIVQHCTIKKCKELGTEKNRAEIGIQGYGPVGSLNPFIPLPSPFPVRATYQKLHAKPGCCPRVS